ncbi:zf-CCCH type zinc finger protein [Schizosaccharomyces japonicus yFS275]|uniref:Zf-CCCH type zinc finger protein n=1 Tax=Schizosaccharomyces japonicus (strain yFS275 / FY16936) TaxID=402676 RepID=B6K3K2_SCHJY|nr:zf-CCCH type zinc finger protein [Schizosaccharomyces japonicus yFS275]EEB08059.1 zf-CCCH type zinc finger protein [Schizosaccharomyces japonicus yFS275]
MIEIHSALNPNMLHHKLAADNKTTMDSRKHGKLATRDAAESSVSGGSGMKNLHHVPCKFFRQGACTAGNNCPFSHSLDNERSPCKYFLKGNCKFGSKCALSHSPTALQAQFSEQNGSLKNETSPQTNGARRMGRMSPSNNSYLRAASSKMQNTMPSSNGRARSSVTYTAPSAEFSRMPPNSGFLTSFDSLSISPSQGTTSPTVAAAAAAAVANTEHRGLLFQQMQNFMSDDQPPIVGSASRRPSLLGISSSGSPSFVSISRGTLSSSLDQKLSAVFMRNAAAAQQQKGNSGSMSLSFGTVLARDSVVARSNSIDLQSHSTVSASLPTRSVTRALTYNDGSSDEENYGNGGKIASSLENNGLSSPLLANGAYQRQRSNNATPFMPASSHASTLSPGSSRFGALFERAKANEKKLSLPTTPSSSFSGSFMVNHTDYFSEMCSMEAVRPALISRLASEPLLSNIPTKTPTHRTLSPFLDKGGITVTTSPLPLENSSRMPMSATSWKGPPVFEEETPFQMDD